MLQAFSLVKCWHPSPQPELNTGFELGQQYECIKLLGHQRCQKTLQTDGFFVFCFLFSLDKYAVL